MKKEFWISAYKQNGGQFGDSIRANDVDELFLIFERKYPYADLVDYGEYEDDQDLSQDQDLSNVDTGSACYEIIVNGVKSDTFTLLIENNCGIISNNSGILFQGNYNEAVNVWIDTFNNSKTLIEYMQGLRYNTEMRVIKRGF